MIIGVISDIHANIIALDAVLQELKSKGADTIINLGDVVGYGPTPNEVIDLLRKERVFSTIGSADERIAYDFARGNIPREGVADSTLEWTRTIIEEKNIKYLRSLPVQLRLNTPAGRLRFFHGSPETPATRTDLNQDPLTIGKMFTKNRCNILVAGGSHVPFYKQYGKSWVINPGSVGLSLNGEPGADYALIEFDNTGEAIVSMGKVEYDFAAVAFDIIAWGLPDIVAEAIQQGKFPNTISQE